MAWHSVTHMGSDVYRISEPLGAIEPRFGVDTADMYLVLGQERAALIDSGTGIGDARAVASEITDLPVMVLNTHYHWDHSGANWRFEESAIHDSEADHLSHEANTRWIHAALESPTARAALPPGFDVNAYRIPARPASWRLGDGDQLGLGGRVLKAYHTPGHSLGHMTYLDGTTRILFTGDMAYRGPIYVCFEESDPAAFLASVQRMARLPDVDMLCPGHNGPIEDSGWLRRLAENAALAVSGVLPASERVGMFKGREIQLDDHSIWLPACATKPRERLAQE